MMDTYEEGWDAYHSGCSLNKNPYDESERTRYANWRKGWLDAADKAGE